MMAQGPNAIIDHIFPEIALENQMEVAHMRRKFAPMDPGQLREWAQTQGPANLQPFRGRLLETPVKDQEEKKEDLEEEDGGEEGDDGYNDAAPPAISQVLEYYTTNYGIDVAGAHLDDFSTQIWLKLAKMAKAGDAKWRWHLDHLPPEMNKSAAEVFVRWVDVVVEEIMEGGGKY
ncbi:hypothetical protein EDC01DRAFT_656328 [Geopyxis carbonaria]|nr:hypothetical protein EDC01DRAFT_656328 [Geopyxis carbonaria]